MYYDRNGFTQGIYSRICKIFFVSLWVMRKYFNYYLEYTDEQVFEIFKESVMLEKQ